MILIIKEVTHGHKILAENKAAFSRIILLIKKCVFTCIMAVYIKKDCVNEKTQVLTPELWRFVCLIFGRDKDDLLTAF